jgi:hypothetical protein
MVGLRVAGVVILLFLATAAVHAEARIALLIGNQAYKSNVGPLKNPHVDLALIGAALRSLGFQVTEVRDAGYRAVDTAIKRHAAAVRRKGPGTISFFYYSGHGAADPETKINYLIPIDVASADDESLWINSLNLNKIVDGLREEAPAATHYVVFDACRNELNLTQKGKKAIADKGFTPIGYAPGVMIAYATAPGRTAADGNAGGGPYARILAEEIVKPGVEAVTMFRRVALRVNHEIGQDPWLSASTLPEIYFAGELVGLPLQVAPVSKLFLEADLARVIAAAKAKQLPLPSFKIYKPSGDISEGLRRFLGIWVSGFGVMGTSRQWMTIIVAVTREGRAYGYQVRGPPKPNSTQTPAASLAFTGRISGDRLSYSTSRSKVVISMRDRRLDYKEIFRNGVIARVLLDPVWTMIDAEHTAATKGAR